MRRIWAWFTSIPGSFPFSPLKVLKLLLHHFFFFLLGVMHLVHLLKRALGEVKLSWPWVCRGARHGLDILTKGKLGNIYKCLVLWVWSCDWEGKVEGTAKRYSWVSENACFQQGYVRQGGDIRLEFVHVQMFHLKLLDLFLPIFLLHIAWQ